MKRFCYVCADPGIPVPGSKGASIHIQSVCKALGDAGLTGEICVADARDETLGGVPILPIARPKPVKGESKRQHEVRRFLGSLGSRITGDPSCEFIYERYSLWNTSGLARARELNVPLILEVNSPLPDEARQHRGLFNHKLAEAIAELLMQQADGIVCVSDSVAEWVVEARGHDEGVWIISNGVDAELFSPGGPRRQPPLPPEDVPVVAFCGSFRPWHATDDLLEAFGLLIERIPEAHLVCIGDGPMRADFEETARAMGLGNRVHLTGAIPQSEVPRWLRGANAAVAPYRAEEPFYFSPLKLFEFLSLGLPIVAADIGQIRDVVPHGERGLLYRPGDTRQLAELLTFLLWDRKSGAELGQAGRAWVLANATWQTQVASILRKIETLNNGDRGRA